MSRVTGYRGVFAVDWAQVLLGDEPGLAPEMMTTGMSWRWHGRATKLDAGPEALWLQGSLRMPDRRAGARRRVGRLRGLADARTQPGASRLPDADGMPMVPAQADLPPDSVSLTDGCHVYHARLVRDGGRVLAAFAPFLPPQDHELWVCAWQPPRAPASRRGGVICFLPGTRIDTPRGPRPIEGLVPGDRVLTRDNGPQPVMWRGETQLSGAELFLYPHLRPVRIRAGALSGALAGTGGAGDAPAEDLVVSPGHRLMLRDREALFNTPEVLVTAADLQDGRGIRRDFTLSSVVYVHLMFPGHQIISANGLACESFHPGLADPAVLNWHARSIERACPGLVAAPYRLGPEARRCLTTPEAQILRHAMA
ncbi:MAG: Hint domain-containing protein [Pararhodobacter sp.]|nr:Hint domain-containing protein [Pararhodobacter sp.]